MSQLRERLRARPGSPSSGLFGTRHLPGVSPSSAAQGRQRGGRAAGALPMVPLASASAKGARSRPLLQKKRRWSRGPRGAPRCGQRPGSLKPTATRRTSPAAGNGTSRCFGTPISGMSQIQLPLLVLQPRVHSAGKSWSTVRDLGLLGVGIGAASLCSRSPRCNTSSSAAPSSQKPSRGPTFLL